MKSLTIRVPDSLKELIAVEAAKAGLTQSDFLRRLIETHIGQIEEESFQRESSEDVSLSPFQRKLLSLNYQILLASQGDSSDDRQLRKFYETRIEALNNGYTGEYPGIFGDDPEPLSYSDCKQVWDILDMFRVINASVESLGKDGWETIQIPNAEHFGTFRGFDLQSEHESRLVGYVSYLVDTERWQEQKPFMEVTGGNSHREMLPTYLAMLAEFKPIWRDRLQRGGNYNLTIDDIRRILLSAPGAHT